MIYLQIGIALFAIISTALIFYNTVITKKWRNQAHKEQDSWVLGFIYYNPDDRRILIPKKTGLGITFNYAKPISILVTIAMLLLIILYIIYAI